VPRPIKNKADYFSHDANASSSKTLTILFNHFGHEGISAWWQLLELISGTDNQVIDTRNPVIGEFLAAKMHFNPERLKEILKKMAELNAIDFDLYQDGIIWCQNLVDRLVPVYKKRGLDVPRKPIISVTETPVTVTETPVTVTETRQSKVKERKVKERKVKKKVKKKEKIIRIRYGEFKNVLLSDEELNKIKDKFSGSYLKLIEAGSTWLEQNGKTRHNYYAFLLNWARRDPAKFPENQGELLANEDEEPNDL
jgi:hypothetical protein